jgi:hypothetical protein
MFMSYGRAGKGLVACGALLLWPLCPARGDAIVQRNVKTYGRISAVSSSSVTIIQGCDGASRTVAWADIEYVEVDAKCGGDQLIASRSGAVGCAHDDPLVEVVDIAFEPTDGAAQFVRASQLEYAVGKDAVITLPAGGTVTGSFRKIVSFEKGVACRSELKGAMNSLPPGYSRRKQ